MFSSGKSYGHQIFLADMSPAKLIKLSTLILSSSVSVHGFETFLADMSSGKTDFIIDKISVTAFLPRNHLQASIYFLNHYPHRPSYKLGLTRKISGLSHGC